MANTVTFGTKRFLDVLLGNKAVKQLWWGTHLIWEKVSKALLMDSTQKFLAIEYVPETDVNVNSISVFIINATSYGWTWILNECGLCVARQSNCGNTQETIYGLTAQLTTISSLGTPKLLAGRKYYIFFRLGQWGNTGEDTQFAYYQNKAGNYKEYKISGNVNVYSQVDLQTVPCVGSFSSIGTLSSGVFTQSDFYGSECAADTLIIWRGGHINGTAFRSEPYPMLVKHDMSKFRGMVTDSMLNAYGSMNNNTQKQLALIYYMIGNVAGNEIAWGANDNYSGGLTLRGTSMFNGGSFKIYKGTGNIVHNHITSMTPITAEPDHGGLVLGDIYYKGATTSGWLDSNGNPITDEMVVAWTGSAWEFAANWTYEFDTVSGYTLSTAVELIEDNEAKDFNKISVSTDKKYYLRINGNEV